MAFYGFKEYSIKSRGKKWRKNGSKKCQMKTLKKNAHSNTPIHQTRFELHLKKTHFNKFK